MVAVRPVLTEEDEATVRALEDPLGAFYLTGAALLADLPPPPPPVAWSMEEGGAILREGRRYLVHGEAGIGKSMLALAACIEAALDGLGAVYLDFEDSAKTCMSRAQSMRVTLTERGIEREPELTDHLFYRQMAGEPLSVELPLPDECSLIVVDSLARAIGGDENTAEDFHRFLAIAEALQSRSGAALLLLDHPGHGDPKRGRGTSAKRPAVDVDLSMERAGRDGFRLVVRKDRHADTDAPVNATVAEGAILRSEGGSVRISLRQPSATFTEAGTFRPTNLMGKVSAYLAEHPEGVSGRNVRRDVLGNSDAKALALSVLAEEGYASEGPGRNGGRLYRHVSLYTEREDPKVRDREGFSEPGLAPNQPGPVAPRDPGAGR